MISIYYIITRFALDRTYRISHNNCHAAYAAAADDDDDDDDDDAPRLNAYSGGWRRTAAATLERSACTEPLRDTHAHTASRRDRIREQPTHCAPRTRTQKTLQQAEPLMGHRPSHGPCHMPYAICHMPWAMRGPWAPRLVVPRRLECREHGVERAPATIWIGLAERPSSGVQRIRIPFPHDDPPHTPFGRAWAIRGQRGTQTVHDCVRFARIR